MFYYSCTLLVLFFFLLLQKEAKKSPGIDIQPNPGRSATEHLYYCSLSINRLKRIIFFCQQAV